MELQVSGKLKTATEDQPSFTGCRIEALFDRKPASAPSRPSTSRPVTGGAIGLDDATATSIETGSESGPYQSAAASATSVEAPIPSRVSALSDDAGNFTRVFPDQHEIVSKTVKFTVSSPTRGIMREVTVMTCDLGEAITIGVEAFDAGPFDKPAPTVNTPQSAAVDALFQTDAALRHTITKNLRSRPVPTSIRSSTKRSLAANLPDGPRRSPVDSPERWFIISILYPYCPHVPPMEAIDG